MRSICQRTTLVLVTLLLSILFLQSLLSWQTHAQEASGKRTSLTFQLPKILDWERYKAVFHRIYSNHRDELIRKKIFIAKALETLWHNIGFRMGKFSYFLSINKFSDRTPEEREKMHSGVTLGEQFGSAKNIESDHQNSSGEQQQFKDQSDKGEQEIVDLDLNKLQQELATISISAPKGSSKLAGRTPSSDDLLLLELLTQEDSLSDEEGSRSNQFEDDSDDDADEEFVDWRDSGCLTVPRNQTECGCCYAFATTALMELIHCQQKGELIQFSEQYMVDCGQRHVPGMRGCNGADLTAIPVFLEEWGVQLSSNHPFMAGETSCPYEKEQSHSAGYMRPTLQRFDVIPDKAYWPIVLEKGPMFAVVAVIADFEDYGGKIHQGHNCRSKASYHAMLLVGHGKEDGQAYWIYRNSYGHDWGEGGYFKISKKAKPSCFGPHTIALFEF